MTYRAGFRNWYIDIYIIEMAYKLFTLSTFMNIIPQNSNKGICECKSYVFTSH